jgi:4-diphosphocytidyl-2-C-methyl-D-erythritol kinase
MTRLLAPAKLTLSLAVTGIDAHGYHRLRSEMVSLSLADELTFTEGARGLTVVADPGTRAESLSGDAPNLITQALAAVGRQAAVQLRKRIPLGGGLGGGSTDAAAVLRWAHCKDLAIARTLGSDVPFSVVGGRALVEGTGEHVTPLPFEQRQLLLLFPPFGVDTAKVYAAWDAGARTDTPDGLGNALTAAALAVEPRLAGWRDALRHVAGVEPALAGSGSTWFAEIAQAAEVAQSAGASELPGWLTRGDERARLIAAHTVPAGWDRS